MWLARGRMQRTARGSPDRMAGATPDWVSSEEGEDSQGSYPLGQSEYELPDTS